MHFFVNQTFTVLASFKAVRRSLNETAFKSGASI